MRKSTKQLVSEPPASLASAAVRDEWRRRVEAEYHSCAVAQHLTLWLIQIGASPDLIQAGLGIAADELLHAQRSHEVFVAAGGSGQPRLSRDDLQLPRDPAIPLEHDVLLAGIELFCLGETVAVPLFKELRQRATVPIARATLDRVLVDEVRHRDFGWALLGWLLEAPQSPSLRKLAQAELPAMLERLCGSYGQTAAERDEADKKDSQLTAQDLAWGLMPMATYDAVLRRSFGRDFAPRFARLGIDCPALPRSLPRSE
jgi:hypothetical protein